MNIKYTLLFFCGLFFIATGNAQQAWEDFDNPASVSYFFVNGIAFDEAYANPDNTGINTSALCGSYTRNSAVLYDVIVMDPAGGNMVDDVSDYVAGTKTMSLKVYSPGPGITVQITLEDASVAGPTNYPAGRHSEYLATTTATTGWETLTFALNAQPDLSVANTSINRMVLLFDPGSSSGATFIYDDLMGPELSNPCSGTTPDPVIINDFECQLNFSLDFSNGILTTVANPNPTINNMSADVGRFQKFVPPTNDGAFGGALSFPFNTGTFNQASIQLYSPAAPQDFVFILQDDNNADVINSTITTSGTSDWETFTFDLSGISSATSIENIVLLLDPSTATEDTIFLDNITLSFSNSIAEQQNTLASEVSIYPNPFADQINVSSEAVITEIRIADLAGKTVFQETGFSQTNLNIDAKSFADGAYIITLLSTDGRQLSQKLIK